MLIAGVVGLVLVCICVVIVGALVGGSLVFKLGPFAQSGSNWPVVLSDNFASNSNGWNLHPQPDVSDSGTFTETLAAGKYDIEANDLKPINVQRWPKIPAVSDLSLTVDAKLLSGPQTSYYGLMFRRDENGNFYIFGIREGKQFGVWALYQGQWTALMDWTKTDAVRPGQVNHLNVTAVGSHFTFSINNQQVAAVDNSQLSSGYAGLYFEMGAPGEAVFEFSNFELRAPAGSAQAGPTEQTTLATPASSVQWPVVLSDNFASNANGWNLTSPQPDVSDYGTFTETLAAGKYSVDANALKPVNIKRWPKIPAVSDLSVTVDARQVSGPQTAAYGLIFRKDENGNFYIFGIRGDKQFSVWVAYQGNWTVLINWTKADAIQPGQVNHLNVTAVGSHFTFSINNQQVGAIDNSQVSSGATGVYFEMDDVGEAVFEFSSFELRAPAGSLQATPTEQTTLATPTSSTQWPVVLSDNFNSNANGWNIPDKQPSTSDFGTVNESIGGGRLHLEAKMVKAGSQRNWPKIPAVSDLSLTVEGRRVSGPENSAAYGLFFRRDDNSNFYLFEARDDQQFSVWVFYQGQWTALIVWTKADAIQPGQVNRLNVTAVGSHFTFSINNQQVAAIDNSQVSSGAAGVYFEMDDAGEAVFEFSNFELRAP